jgi:NAD-dependent deacetylase
MSGAGVAKPGGAVAPQRRLRVKVLPKITTADAERKSDDRDPHQRHSRHNAAIITPSGRNTGNVTAAVDTFSIPQMVEIETVRDWFARARRVAALTGAGISADSGVPVFRGPGGLWRRYRPEDLATPEAFARDPRLVWEWYDWRRARVADAKPNPGHYALATLEARLPGFTLITQNVDGLHDRAGSRRLLKLHGDLWSLRCTACGRERRDERVPLPELPPRCECGALLRPGVVWFGEALPAQTLRAATATATSAELFLVIGTSAVVQPAAGLALIARENGARVVEVNPERTPVSDYADASLHGTASEVLPELLASGA